MLKWREGQDIMRDRNEQLNSLSNHAPWFEGFNVSFFKLYSTDTYNFH